MEPGTPRPAFLVVASLAESLLRFRRPLLEALHADGWAVHACAPEPTEALRDELAGIGVTLHAVPLARTGLDPLRDLAFLRALLRLVDAIGARAVLAYTIKPVVWAGIACRIRGVAFFPLVTGLGYAFSGNDAKRAAVRAIATLLLRTSLRGARLAFFQNRDDRDEFVRRRIVPRGLPTHVVSGSGVDLDAYAPAPLPDAPSFLMIGRLLRDKGVHEYAQAARIVRAARPDARFHLVGWIDVNPTAIAQADLRAWQDEGLLHYWGRLDDVRPAIRAARIYVLPSYREGLPRTVLEAMAMGRPVITTDAPGCRETVEPGVNGLRVPVADARALADAMLALAADPARAARMGERSVAIARERFDARTVSAQMVATIRAAA
jgi:glycosyltransferase involved in cell wall biosynthesis